VPAEHTRALAHQSTPGLGWQLERGNPIKVSSTHPHSQTTAVGHQQEASAVLWLAQQRKTEIQSQLMPISACDRGIAALQLS
jgi:hypothetical protein